MVNVRLQTLMAVITTSGLTALITSAVRPPVPQERGGAEKSSDPESEIDTFLGFAMPGKHHQLLSRMAGSWNSLTRYWLKPGILPTESKGTSERKWVLGRRFLLEEFDGGDLALPFRGMGLYGYDAFLEKYTSVWVDTMSTAMLHNQGTLDKSRDVVNFESVYGDPWTGLRKKCRGATRFINKDKHVLELYVTQSDGKEFKMLEITYTRRQQQP